MPSIWEAKDFNFEGKLGKPPPSVNMFLAYTGCLSFLLNKCPMQVLLRMNRDRGGQKTGKGTNSFKLEAMWPQIPTTTMDKQFSSCFTQCICSGGTNQEFQRNLKDSQLLSWNKKWDCFNYQIIVNNIKIYQNIPKHFWLSIELKQRIVLGKQTDSSKLPTLCLSITTTTQKPG